MSSMIRLVHGVSVARCFEDILTNLTAEVADWVGVPVRGALLGTTGREIRALGRWQLPEEILLDGGRQMFLAMTRSAAREAGPVTVTIAGDDPLDPLAAIEPKAKSWTRVGIPLMRDEQFIGMACLYLEDEIRLAGWELEALRRRGEIVALGVEAMEAARTLEAEHEHLHQVAFELVTGYRWALLQEVFGGLTRTLAVSLERRLRESLHVLVDRSRSPEASFPERPDLVKAVVDEVLAAFAELWEPNGHSESTPMPLDVNDVVRRALRIAKTSFEGISRRRGVTIDVRFAPEEHPMVVQGSLVLIGALVHILEGAAQAMPEGGRILVRTSRENGHAVISVEDTGRPSLQMPSALPVDRFSVTDPSVVLSLAQSIVHPYGGRATLSPREESGSALVLYLPTSPSAEPVS
jgi:signal transduction histidine kinase